ncbi:MAG: nucleoside triphosphate pyrophosphohydrolase [Gammaproteobacteria bacterium]|nr:nucleoside triphosphate pyrophosphohydrolase [Gammaproteobacteria bacterium]
MEFSHLNRVKKTQKETNVDIPTEEGINKLLNVMKKLRCPDNGCNWDMSQTFDTVSHYTIEEAYEVVGAIQSSDMHQLKEELGDLLFQVVFLSRIAEEKGLFNFNDVANGISDKMIERHPHVFDTFPAPPPDLHDRTWEKRKAFEREIKNSNDTSNNNTTGQKLSLLDDLPNVFPALLRSEKLQKRAASVGFDWDNWIGPYLKIKEELLEVELAITKSDNDEPIDKCYKKINEKLDEKMNMSLDFIKDEVQDELGDLLFSCVNLGRKLGINSETSLLKANDKFERRFRQLEEIIEKKNKSINFLDLPELNEIWISIKNNEVESNNRDDY